MKKLTLLLFSIMLGTGLLSAQNKTELSDNILHYFHLMEASMRKSGETIDKNNASILADFDFSMRNEPEKTKPYWDRAHLAHKETREFVKFVEDLKRQFEMGTGGRGPEEKLLGSKDMVYHTKILLNQGKGAELKRRINDLRKRLIVLLEISAQKTFRSDLFADDGPNSFDTWEANLFENTPLAAVMAILTKIQNDAKNSEADVLAKLAHSITNSGKGFSNLEARVIPNSTYVILGDEYKADIFLAAYDDKANYPVFVNGEQITTVAGIGKYTARPSREGEIKYYGEIQVRNPTGTLQPYKFEQSFFAFKPAATIAATKMNVLYIGVDNPISVSVPGVRPDDVVVSASAGTLLPIDASRGYYDIQLPAGIRETIIMASAKTGDKTMPMGAMKFRVLSLPTPKVFLGNIDTPVVSAERLKASNVMNARMGAEFAFVDLEFTVTEFSFMHIPKAGSPVKLTVEGSPNLDAAMKELCNKVVPGDQVLIYNVKAKGPTGLVALDNSLLLTVK